MHSPFAENLAAALRGRGLTQTALAQALGTSHVTVSGWLRGKTHPNAEYQGRLMEALDVPLDALLYGRITVLLAFDNTPKGGKA